jgi:hypothetical protein
VTIRKSVAYEAAGSGTAVTMIRLPPVSHGRTPPDSWRGAEAVPTVAVLGLIIAGQATGSHPILGVGIFLLGLLSLVWSLTKRDDRLVARALFVLICCGIMALGLDAVVSG